jgi:sugar transferase EpsL
MKRVFDLAMIVLFAPIWLPLILFTAMLVRFRLGAPVLFRQTRPGLHGRPFTLSKFRSMTDRRNAAGQLLADEQRLTRFGKWLRSTSLDELPELFHVLNGEMSLVGPRPLLTQYLDRYSPRQARRHEVKPGLTGWSQVNGRNALSWEDKLELDVWYVEHQSLWLDLKILALTFAAVLRRKGIAASGSATAPEFMGSPATQSKPAREGCFPQRFQR